VTEPEYASYGSFLRFKDSPSEGQPDPVAFLVDSIRYITFCYGGTEAAAYVILIEALRRNSKLS